MVGGLMSTSVLVARYRCSCGEEEALRLARFIAVEQTVEVPEALIARYPLIEKEIVGQVCGIEKLGEREHQIDVSFDSQLAGCDLNQLLNLIWGNISLIPHLRLVDLDLPDSLLARYCGPAMGIEGLRQLLGVEERPLLATALKPRGAPVDDLQAMAEAFARGGGDLIKDDHNLIDSSFEEFCKRTGGFRDAVARGREAAGGNTLYLAHLCGPSQELEKRLGFLESEGVDGVLVAPTLIGFDRVRDLAASSRLIFMSHPTASGGFVAAQDGGIEAGIFSGTLMRLAGIDISVFCNSGGRFHLKKEDAISIADRLRTPLGNIATSWPSPAGGMELDRLDELIDTFGADTLLLIGGALLCHDGGVEAGTAHFRSMVADRFKQL